MDEFHVYVLVNAEPLIGGRYLGTVGTASVGGRVHDEVQEVAEIED